MTKAPCVDMTCSAGSSTSTAELHERVYVPHTRSLPLSGSGGTVAVQAVVIAELREVNARLVAANAALATRVGELDPGRIRPGSRSGSRHRPFSVRRDVASALVVHNPADPSGATAH
jgi:hypothetical protein